MVPFSATVLCLACALFLPSYFSPINIPERILVLTMHISSNDKATISNSVEPFASRPLLSFTPHVNQFVKSAIYFPAQATMTNAAQMYCPTSQPDSDATSGLVKITVDYL